MKLSIKLLVIPFACIMFAYGCREGVSRASIKELLSLENNQKYIEHWACVEIKNRLSDPSVAVYAPGALGHYKLLQRFNWGQISKDIVSVEERVLGERENPVGIIFYIESDCAVIYCFNEKELIGTHDITSKELEWIAGRIALYRGSR